MASEARNYTGVESAPVTLQTCLTPVKLGLGRIHLVSYSLKQSRDLSTKLFVSFASQMEEIVPLGCHAFTHMYRQVIRSSRHTAVFWPHGTSVTKALIPKIRLLLVATN